jgi:hypothetical protein
LTNEPIDNGKRLVCVTKEGLDGEATVNPDISIADNSVIFESMKNLCTGIGSLDLNKIHRYNRAQQTSNNGCAIDKPG